MYSISLYIKEKMVNNYVFFFTGVGYPRVHRDIHEDTLWTRGGLISCLNMTKIALQAGVFAASSVGVWTWLLQGKGRVSERTKGQAKGIDRLE